MACEPAPDPIGFDLRAPGSKPTQHGLTIDSKRALFTAPVPPSHSKEAVLLIRHLVRDMPIHASGARSADLF